MTPKCSILAAILAASATPALAHTGVHSASDFVAGLTHPFLGLDHMAAMIAVGLFAASLGGRALWAVPASFVTMMLVGGVLGLTGITLPAVETGIAASVVVLGLAVATGRSWPVQAAMALVGFFAAFHGYAHGAEIPAGVGMGAYSLGFALATAMLHGLGMIAGLVALRSHHAVRLAGAAVAVAGAIAVVG